MANYVYPDAKLNLATRHRGGGFDFDADTFYGMLVTAAYVPAATHVQKSDITNEVVGSGYTAGGQVLTGVTATLNGSGNFVFDAADPSWNPATITARGMVILKRVGAAVAGTDPVLGYIDFGADKTSTDGPFTVQFDPTGALILS